MDRSNISVAVFVFLSLALLTVHQLDLAILASSSNAAGRQCLLPCLCPCPIPSHTICSLGYCCSLHTDLWPFSPSHFILWTVVQLKSKPGHALPLLNSFCDCTGIKANVIHFFHQSHPQGTFLLHPSQAYWGPDCSLYAPGPLCSHLSPPWMLWLEPHFFKWGHLSNVFSGH